MSDPSKDPAQKKRVVRSRVAAPAAATPAASPAPVSAAAVPASKPSPSESPGLRAPARDAATSPGPRPANDSPGTPAAPRPAAEDAAASAALALAVLSARKEGASDAAPDAKPAQAVPAPARPASLLRRPVAQAAALVVAVAAGWLGAEAFATTRAQADGAPWTETAQALRQGQQDVVRLTGDIKTLKVAIDALRDSVDRSKTDLMARQAQVIERVERSAAAPGDSGARLARMAEQLDRVETTAKEPGVKLAALAERFDRLERQITTLQSAAARPAPAEAAAAAKPAPAEIPTQTGSLETKPAAKDPAKDVQIEGWVLHEVYDGVALVEGRNRRLYEVGLGGVIPGLGPVEAIERRGKRWVVVTAKGFIGNER